MQLAVIREIDCVGCGKCLPACPVDAIIGAPKFLYSILEEECIGCKLCVSPCPMDCIDMIETSIQPGTEQKRLRAEKAKKRYQARTKRLIKRKAPLLADTSSKSYKAKILKEIDAVVARKGGNSAILTSS